MFNAYYIAPQEFNIHNQTISLSDVQQLPLNGFLDLDGQIIEIRSASGLGAPIAGVNFGDQTIVLEDQESRQKDSDFVHLYADGLTLPTENYDVTEAFGLPISPDLLIRSFENTYHFFANHDGIEGKLRRRFKVDKGQKRGLSEFVADILAFQQFTPNQVHHIVSFLQVRHNRIANDWHTRLGIPLDDPRLIAYENKIMILRQLPNVLRDYPQVMRTLSAQMLWEGNFGHLPKDVRHTLNQLKHYTQVLVKA